MKCNEWNDYMNHLTWVWWANLLDYMNHLTWVWWANLLDYMNHLTWVWWGDHRHNNVQREDVHKKQVDHGGQWHDWWLEINRHLADMIYHYEGHDPSAMIMIVELYNRNNIKFNTGTTTSTIWKGLTTRPSFLQGTDYETILFLS